MERGIKLKKTKVLAILLVTFIFSAQKMFSLSIGDLDDKFSSLLHTIMPREIDSKEGETSFNSLLIPVYSRAEALGGSYTGISDDIGFIEYNPAASSVLTFTELGIFHNQWIGDSAIDEVAWTGRTNNLGYGFAGKCFYVPFTQYNTFGRAINSSYYTETVGAANISYNIARGYTFKGIAIGLTVKGGYRSMPSFIEDEENNVKNKGLSNSAFAVMADAGVLLRFNLAKIYSSREPNLRIGVSANNIGVAFTNLGSTIDVKEGLPSSVSAGVSYTFLKPFTLSGEFKLPFNMMNAHLGKWSAGLGLEYKLSSALSLLGGLQLKNDNPVMSIGAQAAVEGIQLNMSYSLDFASSLTPLNRISMSAKIQIGDRGRIALQNKVDDLYRQGILYYVECCRQTDTRSALEYLDLAIETLEEVIATDKSFDPAQKALDIMLVEKENLSKVQNEQMLE